MSLQLDRRQQGPPAGVGGQDGLVGLQGGGGAGLQGQGVGEVTLAGRSFYCTGEGTYVMVVCYNGACLTLKWLVSTSTALTLPGRPSRKAAHSLPGTWWWWWWWWWG